MVLSSSSPKRSLAALLFRGYCRNFEREDIGEGEGDIGTLRFPSKTRRREESTSIDDSMGMGHKKRGVEIRWLEIVQADYTFSFVLKYGGSQRENNVSLITRFGSTRATPALLVALSRSYTLPPRSVSAPSFRSIFHPRLGRTRRPLHTHSQLRLHRRNGD